MSVAHHDNSVPLAHCPHGRCNAVNRTEAYFCGRCGRPPRETVRPPKPVRLATPDLAQVPETSKANPAWTTFGLLLVYFVVCMFVALVVRPAGKAIGVILRWVVVLMVWVVYRLTR